MTDKTKLLIVIESFGLKTGKPIPPSDLYLDARVLMDPTNGTMKGHGSSTTLQDFILDHSGESVHYIKALVKEAIDLLPMRRGDKLYSKPFHILCMCAHGMHRSVALKHILAAHLKMAGWNVEVR